MPKASPFDKYKYHMINPPKEYSDDDVMFSSHGSSDEEDAISGIADKGSSEDSNDSETDALLRHICEEVHPDPYIRSSSDGGGRFITNCTFPFISAIIAFWRGFTRHGEYCYKSD